MPSTTGRMREGIILGLIGYATVAAFFAIFDILAARGWLYTVNLLGRATFRGLRDPAILQSPVAVDSTAIGLFNGLHLVASLAIGIVVTWFVTQIEGTAAQRRLAIMGIVAGFLVTIFGIGMITAPIRPLLPWWSVVLANVFAVCMGALYLLRRHPGLIGRLQGALA